MTSGSDVHSPVITTRLAGRVVQVQPVIVTDFQMPFASMVGFMVKWAIAAIPAIVILFVIFAVLGGIFGAFMGGLLNN